MNPSTSYDGRYKERVSRECEFPPPCVDTQHNPPMHLWIPPGKQFTHKCPSCGAKMTIKGQRLSC